MTNNTYYGVTLITGLGIGLFSGMTIQHRKQMKKVREMQPLFENMLAGMNEAVSEGASAEEYLEKLWMELNFINQVVK